MRKNGFTLIELLAVIVILAIIALIATPIILGIINDAREKANERSVELYASAVRNGIAAYQLREMKEVAPGTYTKETLPFEVEYDGKVECTEIIISDDNKVSLTGCKVNNGEKEYSYGIEEEKVAYLKDVCDPVSVATTGVYTAGDKYTCTVDPNKPAYTFYILTTPAEGEDNVNLIMDSNININGEAVKEGVIDKGFVFWIGESDYPANNWSAFEDNNEYGPITAMNHLQIATRNWTNLNIIEVSTFEANGDQIKPMAQTYKVYARMPYRNEMSNYNENSSSAYLYDNLKIVCRDFVGDEVSCDVADEKVGVFVEGIEHISEVGGYWIPYAEIDNGCGAGCVLASSYIGQATSTITGIDNASIGVRPVINLSI